ncbi:patatin-like phospholipase family protein [Thermobispora bispora]|nr:patatin-like phospholipase family protein [Thermobispora bispora]MBO2473823.1 patatin [Actinomycetales bacterium]MDI9580773.1 patatin-like phospholipase family protein [Thermobispora sp.]QRD80994.1 lipolytic protein [uncultured bacterium]MBX6168282.1 patatin-like phospholipase family protein [Thermobispora bispora]QRD81077.1 lipolytic protein [uncultured bacterium]
MISALVLGGGGVAGVAWEAGVVHGLRQKGIDLGTADRIIGTSAGSVTGTLIATGADLEEAIARQAAGEPARHGDGGGKVDMDAVMAAFAVLYDESLEPKERRRRLGQMALAAQTGITHERLRKLGEHLPVREWPDRELLITAVDAETGEFVVWRRESGVPLELAIASSCCVPMVFPPIEINGRRYVDGGVRSSTNADLAEGAEVVVVLEPLAHMTPRATLEKELSRVGAARQYVIAPDEAAIEVFGTDVLSPHLWEPAYQAGLAQAAKLAEPLREVWTG